MRIKIKKKVKKGSALAYALVIMSVTMIILVSMIGYVTSQLRFSSSRVEKENALQIAEAGINWYRWYLAHETAGKTAQEINDFWQDTSNSPLGVDGVSYEQNFNDPEGGIIGHYRIDVERPDSNSTIAIVKSTGWTDKMPSLKRTIQVRFRRPSWSEYSVLANDFMRFGEGTNVYGEIHSNKGIRFDGLAHNTISSLVANYDDPDHVSAVEFGVHTHVRVPPSTGVSDTSLSSERPPTNPVPVRNDVFLVGRNFPVPEVSFNGVLSDLNFMRTQSQNPAYGRYFDGSNYGRRITLRSNGTMDVRRVIDYNKDTFDSCGKVNHNGTNAIISQSAVTNYPIPDNGIVFVEDNVWVEGTVNNKRVTIVAGAVGANIYVGMNDIIYTNIDGRDIIGLVAQKDVEVIRESRDNLRIDAALLAQSGRVGRKYYSCRNYNSNGSCTTQSCADYSAEHRNTITINGSIATNLRYGFAYVGGTGYANRNLNFDNNLLYYPPPYFPTGTEYSIDLWEEL